MSNHIQSVYLKVPPEAAKRLWSTTSPQLRSMLFGFKAPVALHFIPAEGGCVIAAVCEVQQVSERVSLLSRNRIRALRGFISRLEFSPKALGAAIAQTTRQLMPRTLDGSPLWSGRADRQLKMKVYEVLPDSKGWQVAARTQGAVDWQIFSTKDEALKWARAQARQETPSRLRVRRRDGQLQTEFTYSSHPHRTTVTSHY